MAMLPQFQLAFVSSQIFWMPGAWNSLSTILCTTIDANYR
jgi:hypothetical protein